MPKPTEEQIRKRTQEIWELLGKPEGKRAECRFLAEQGLRDKDKSDPMRVPDNFHGWSCSHESREARTAGD